METGQAMLGMTTMGVGWEAWNGTGEWTKGQRFRAMRAILPMYDSPFTIAGPRRLGVKSLSGLAGKRLGAGPRAGTSGTYFPKIFEALGIPVTLIYGSLEEMGSQVIAGQLDGVALATGVPVPALLEVEAKEPLEFIPFTPEQLAIVRRLMPELGASTLPRGSYPSLTEDYPTVGLFNFVIAHKDLPEELVYRAVKAVYDNHDRLVRAHSAGRETIPANVGHDTFLPLHPGAVRYYRRSGSNSPRCSPVIANQDDGSRKNRRQLHFALLGSPPSNRPRSHAGERSAARLLPPGAAGRAVSPGAATTTKVMSLRGAERRSKSH